MAAPLPPTLGELRKSVGIRAGLATNGTLSNTVLGVIDEAINSAQRRIFLRAAWARLLVTKAIPLVADTRDYDLPEPAAAVGDVQLVVLVSATGTRDVLPYDDTVRLSETQAATAGRPSCWAFIDDVIRLDKTPDVNTYARLDVEVMTSDRDLTAEQHRACVDGEAIKALASITVKRLLGIDFDLKMEMAEFERYMLDLRATRSGPGRSFSLASERDPKLAYRVDNGATWNPW